MSFLLSASDIDLNNLSCVNAALYTSFRGFYFKLMVLLEICLVTELKLLRVLFLLTSVQGMVRRSQLSLL